jgi:16S rRNA (cytidine1402-2'-O)-methyltransferase
MLGTLFVVGLPIGNLKDITLRAIEVLKKVEYIVCEDTRTLKNLLNYYKCGSKKLISFYKDVERQKEKKILDLLKNGEDVVLVSEAGTPLISDPGARLVKKAYIEGIKVIPVPGVSALTCALSVSGIPLNQGFIFLGFLPRKFSEQKEIFENLPKNLPVVIFESPHRIKQTAENLLKILGNRECFLAREMTKFHEELIWTNLEKLSQRENIKGEITLIIMPCENTEQKKFSEEEILKKGEELLKKNIKLKEVAKILAKEYEISAKEIYDFLVKRNCFSIS